MKQYDFVFIYEGKNRELENICLIRCELERRGYSVAFVETWDQVFYRTRPLRTKVTICFALYNDDTVRFVTSFVEGCNKLVNMQWEQVFRNGDVAVAEGSREDQFKRGIYQSAQNACHISWGENNRKRLTEGYHVSPDHVRVTGHVSLDFLRPELRDYYLSRDDLLYQYQIPAEKKIFLFISSLSYAALPEEVLNSPVYRSQNCDITEFASTSKKTQAILLEWFQKLLAERDDCVVIYRPHPAENACKLLEDAAVQIPGFYVISDHSVKQWILAADYIYTWYSTSVAEIRAAGKNCAILRPVEIARDAELENHNRATFVRDYESFLKTIDHPREFPIPEEDFAAYYSIDQEKPSYIRVCDYLEEIYQNNQYCMDISTASKPYSYVRTLVYNLRSWIYQKNITKGWMKRFLKIRHPEMDVNAYVENYLYNMRMRGNNHMDKAEIQKIMNRIQKNLNQADRITETPFNNISD